MDNQLVWEVVYKHEGSAFIEMTQRAKVSGGWIYQTTVVFDEDKVALATVFVSE